jgi:hypothetical protein
MTKDVFEIYSQMVGSQNIFTLKNGLLVTSVTGIPKEYLDRTEEHLSNAVRQIERTKDNQEKSHQGILDRLAKETGRAAGKAPGS